VEVINANFLFGPTKKASKQAKMIRHPLSAVAVLPLVLLILASPSAITADTELEPSSSSTSSTATSNKNWMKHSLKGTRIHKKQSRLRVQGVPRKRVLAQRRERGTQRRLDHFGYSGKKSGSSAKSGKKSYSFDDEMALEACYEFADRNEEGGIDFGTECECLHTDFGVVANCIDDCLYCNDMITTCGIRAAQALFTEEGDITAIGGVFEYLLGKQDEVIAVERFECTVDDGNFVETCEQCAVYVDGYECNSCVFEDCGNGIQAEQIDCENIEVGATFDLCEDISLDVGDTFEVFNSDEFEECIDPDEISLSRSSKKSGKKSGKGSSYSSDELPEPQDALFLDSIKSGKRKAKSRRKLETERKNFKR
jgi:hypothetical protein